jgi:osmotically-inducible protein OsmY
MIGGRLLAGLAAGALLIAALPAFADDAQIQRRVEARLEKAKLGNQGDVRVAVHDGAVTLNGAVTTVSARRAAAKAARKEAKVVENRLKVLPEERADADVSKDVRSAILRYPRYTVFDSVEYAVNDGVVILQGSVRQPWRRSDIDDQIARIAGVREVRNEIAVQGVSSFDDSLRRQLYRRIYGSVDSVMGTYASMANPPVRIIVDKGKVTLTGYVSSPVQRTLVGNIARQTLAFEVTNRIQIEGEPPAADRQAQTQS